MLSLFTNSKFGVQFLKSASYLVAGIPGLLTGIVTWAVTAIGHIAWVGAKQ